MTEPRTTTASADRLAAANPPDGSRRTFVGLVIIGAIATTGVLYVLVYWWGLQRASNFLNEVWPAYQALFHGHVSEFLQLGPQYVGSLILRAPFALIAMALGGGARATYFATALPCLLTAPVLGAWLTLRPRQRTGTGLLSRISPIVFFAFNPIVVMALIIGHPEDILGAVLCVAAVVLALDGSGGWAGLLTGIAVANKPWALVAAPVVLVALPKQHRRAVLMMALSAGVILLPAFLARQQHGVGASGAVQSFGSQVSTIFLRPELLWWFGPHAWIVREAHVAIVVTCALAAGAWWLVRGRRQVPRREDDVLLLLVMVMLLRASLDPWNNVYYHAPFIFALMAYEARRTPWLTLIYSCLLIVVVPPILLHDADLNAGAYSAVAGGTLVILAGRLFLPDRLKILRFPRSLRALGVRAPGRQPEPSS